MNLFTIESNDFLDQDIQAFYHTGFYGYGNANNPDYLNILKYDSHQNWTAFQLKAAANKLRSAVMNDLPQILSSLNLNKLTLCIIPRSKADNTYRSNQVLFKSTIKELINEINGFVDGTDYIMRHTNTRTTHLRRPTEDHNDGHEPYIGITTDTCNISTNVRNADILLIDDIYTKTVNIDEDAIQALLSHGAKSVTFYAVGHTMTH